MSKGNDNKPTTQAPEAISGVNESTPSQTSINGQSAFHVELSPVGVVVRTVFVGEDASLHAAPLAVFDNIETAMHQLDELKRIVIRHFGEAAVRGFQAIQQAQPPATNPSDMPGESS